MSMKLEADCREALEALGVTNGRLLVAVSGGRDSRVLLELARRAAPSLGLELVVGHVDHQLRGEASTADAEFVAACAEKAGILFAMRRVAPGRLREEGSSRSRPTLEEAARQLRREALQAMALEAGAAWIATAHHLGDQAETVLLRVLRGTGPEGLAAMAPRSRDGRWIRPLLDVDPQTIEDFAELAGLEFREDASNLDRAFTRNRLRHDWIPGLSETFNPRLLRTLADLAETQRRDVDWIESLVEAAARERIECRDGVVRLALDGWEAVPEALARRLVRRALLEAEIGRDLSRTHLLRVLALLRRGRSVGRDKRVELPGGLVLRRDDESFVLERRIGENGIERVDNARVMERD